MLIVILILLTLTSLGSIHFLEKQIVLLNVLGRLKQQATDRLKAENDLLEKESRILSHAASSTDSVGIFVPDHLGFGCDEGQKIIEVKSGPFQSFVGVPYTPSSDQWSSDFKLFFDHAVIHSPYSRVLKPRTQWDPVHSKLVDWVGMPPLSNIVFAVSNTGLQNEGLLYVLDGQQGGELTHHRLGRPLSRGSITQTALIYQGRLRSVLILVAEDARDRRVHLWIFDRNTPGGGLREIIHQPVPVEYSFSTLKPMALKGTDGVSTIVLSLCKGAEGVLLFFKLDTHDLSSIALRGGVLRSLTAVDERGRGFCDGLYMANAEGLWLLPLGSHPQRIQKLCTVSVDSKIMVLPHRHRMGVVLYFLGEKAGKRGLCCVEVLQENRSKTPSWIGEPALVLQGAFTDFWIRSGRIVLVSNRLEQQPMVWDICAQRLLALHWESIFSHGGQGSILGAQLVWGPTAFDAKIILFDGAGRTSIFATSLHQNQQGRLAFRRTGDA